LNEGVIIALDTPANLKATYDSSVVKVALDDGRIQRFDTGNPADFRQYEHLKASGQQFTIQHEDSTLEQVFMRLTGRSLNQ